MVVTKKSKPLEACFFDYPKIDVGKKLLRFEEILHFVFMNDRFLERISACFGATNGFDHLRIVLCLQVSFRVFLDRGFCCFSHDILFEKLANVQISKSYKSLRICTSAYLPIVQLLDFFVNGYFLQNRIVFLQLNTLRSILLILL